MDFRSTQPQSNHSAAPVGPAGSPVKVERPSKKDREASKWLRTGMVALLFSITVIIIAIIGIISLGGNDQNKFVKSGANNYQAVFLTNGQVYFGNIDSFGRDYINLTNIYYLTQNTTTSNGQTTTDGNYTLVKLGCQQIHDPFDQMIISRDQVSFWENLQANGKVVTSIKAFQKQNPNGPDCSQVSSQTQASSTSDSSAQGSSTTGTSSNSSTSATTGNSTTNSTTNTTKP